MRVKLSDKYPQEREEICRKIIEILELDDQNSFYLHDLDNNEEKQKSLLDMKETIRKYFAVSNISTFMPNQSTKRPYLNLIRSILRQEGYIITSCRVNMKNKSTARFYILKPH